MSKPVMSKPTIPKPGMSNMPNMSKAKSRVALRIKEKVYAPSLNRNVDVEAAAQKFRALQKRLRLLANALRSQYSHMIALQKSRWETVKLVTEIANKSPVAQITGVIGYDGAILGLPPRGGPTNVGSPSTDSNAENEYPLAKDTAFGTITTTEKPAGGKLEDTYASVHNVLHRRGVLYAEKFNQFVINYVLEWDTVVSTRINAGLKQSETLRRDLDHYHRKVESLRASTGKTVSSGKIVDPKNADRLKRNEVKLLKAREEHELFTHRLYLLIEEVTDRAWKDLHPLLVKLLQFDVTYSADESKILADLNNATELLKKVGIDHKIDAKGRMKLLQSATAEELYTGDMEIYTRPPGERGDNGHTYDHNPGVDDGLRWNNSAGAPPPPDNSYGMHNASDQSLLDDGLFAHGGGSEQNGSSFLSSPTGAPGGGLSSTDMLTVAAASAPRPTLDMVNELNTSVGNLSLLQNDPNQKSWNDGNWTNDSLADGSMVGFGPDTSELPMAPAPAAPPPPPPPGSTLAVFGDTGPGPQRSSSFSQSMNDQLIPSQQQSYSAGRFSPQQPPPQQQSFGSNSLLSHQSHNHGAMVPHHQQTGNFGQPQGGAMIPHQNPGNNSMYGQQQMATNGGMGNGSMGNGGMGGMGSMMPHHQQQPQHDNYGSYQRKMQYQQGGPSISNVSNISNVSGSTNPFDGMNGM